MIRNALWGLSFIALLMSLAAPLCGFAATESATKRPPAKSAVSKPASKNAKAPASVKARKKARKNTKASVRQSSKANDGRRASAAPRKNARSTGTLTAGNAPRKAVPLVAKEKKVRKVVVRNGKRQVIVQRVPVQPVNVVPPVRTAGDLAGLHLTQDALALESNAAIVIDQKTGRVLFEKNSQVSLPIASITKLMTALVVLEARQDMGEMLEVSDEDVDREKFSSSRLRVGTRLSRDDMLRIALMSSENRAASALGRHFPGGMAAFIAAMNAKAKALGMADTRFVDPTGLSSFNVSSARDLTRLVGAAHQHATLARYSVHERHTVYPGHHSIEYGNSNRLVGNSDWEIGLQKTGYINEAGRCLVMQARIEGRPVIMVFLDSKGRYSRLADAGRVKKWLATNTTQTAPDRQVTAAAPKL